MSQLHSENNGDERQDLAPAQSPEERVNALRTIFDRSLLTWKLFWDARVGFPPKLLPLFAVIYLVSPIDLLPAWILGPLAPLGVVDDLGVILLALNLFIQASPPDIVQEYLREFSARRLLGRDDSGDVIDGDGFVEEE